MRTRAESRLLARRAGIEPERRLATQHAAVSALAESTSLADAVPRLLEAVGVGLDWDFGALWMPERNGQAVALRCSQTWSSEGVEAAEFDRVSREIELAPGALLPGRVWDSGSPAWIEDVTRDRHFVRAPAARRAGLHTGFAFPVIRRRGRVVAVLEFLTRETREVEDGVLADFTVFGFQMGQFIDREMAEGELRRSRNQLQGILRSVPVGIMVLNRGEEIVFANEMAAGISGRAGVDELLGARLSEVSAGWETYDEHGVPAPGEELPGVRATRGLESPGLLLRIGEGSELQDRWVTTRATPVPDGHGGHLAVCVFEEVSEIKRTEEELRESEGRHRSISHTLQTALAPPEAPRVPGLEVAVRFRALGQESEIGGDFYDLFKTSGRRWALLIGDVAGKGVEAAATAALARNTVRAIAQREDDPEDVLAVLNEAVGRQLPASQFCTAVYGTIELGELWVRIRIAAAGHPPPLLLRSHGGAEEVGGRGPLLAGFEDVRYGAEQAHLGTGDSLVLCTDGVIEAGDRAGSGPGLDPPRLAALLGSCVGLDAEGIAQRVEDAVIDAEAGDPRDDAAIVVLRSPPAGR